MSFLFWVCSRRLLHLGAYDAKGQATNSMCVHYEIYVACDLETVLYSPSTFEIAFGERVIIGR